MSDRILRGGRVAWALVGMAAVVSIVGLLAWSIRVVFPPLILAGAIVFVLNPVVTRLQRRGLPRALGAGVAYLAVAAVVGALGFLVVPVATLQADQLSEDLPEIQRKAERWVDDRAADSKGTILEFTRRDIEQAVSNEDVAFPEQLARLRRLGARIFHVLLILVLAPIIAFYLLVDLPHLRRTATLLIPAGAHDEVLVVARRLNRAIGGFFRGQLLVALIVGVMCSVGLAIIGLRFWFLVGMIAGLFNLIPLVGPWIGGVPGVVIALTTGSPLQAALVVAIMAGAQQVDNHLITPQVMQRAVRLHPAAVMLALLAGGTLAGFFGLLLAVPVAAVLKILVGHLWRIHILGEPLEAAAAAQEADDARGEGLLEPLSREDATALGATEA